MSVKESSCSFPKFSLTPKVLSLKTYLHNCLDVFEELNTYIDQLGIEAETYKTELLAQRGKCSSKTCQGSLAIKEEMVTKENIIKAAVTYLKKLSNTTNSSYGELLKILQGEPAILTPRKDNITNNIITTESNHIKIKNEDNMKTPAAVKVKKITSPKKDLSSSIEDVSFKEDSISEIDATPTGRVSPVMQPKKHKNTSIGDGREKKKCPDEWPSPNPKSTKIIFKGTTPVKMGRGRGRMRQARLPWGAAKTADLVDLTASPDNGGQLTMEHVDVQKPIKKESSENDDTILPSPTSGPTSLLFGCPMSKDKSEFRRPLSLKSRSDKSVAENKPIKTEDDQEIEDMEVSINILQPNRLPKHLKKSPVKMKQESPVKMKQESPVKMKEEPNDDVTHCDTLASASLLRDIERMETDQENVHRSSQVSPKKQPLAENINLGNLPVERCDTESSLSILSSNASASAKMSADSDKKKTPEKVEPQYKEPTVRKKAEKMALPGWVCDECKNFFGTLYKDDPDMVQKAVARCSKHRGRADPARPRTPPGYWQPRWTVPSDTEEFNRRNNAE